SDDVYLPGCTEAGCGPADGVGDVHLSPQSCVLLGISTCLPLNQFKSLPIGTVEGEGNDRKLVGAAKGLFMSFQNKDLDWLGDVDNPESLAAASKGAFLNIPGG